MDIMTRLVHSARTHAAALNRARDLGDVAGVVRTLHCSPTQARRWLADQGNAHIPAIKIKKIDGRIALLTLTPSEPSGYTLAAFLSGSPALPLPK